MRFSVVTLLPQMLRALLNDGVTGRAISRGLVALSTQNPRDHATDPHRTVDDRPYGGGPGMVLKVHPLREAIAAAKQALPSPVRVVFLSPQGRRLDHDYATELAGLAGLVLVCGRYEGIDERIVRSDADEELSIGDYVLSGGELAAAVVIDAVSRLVPGVLGADESAHQDSFCGGLLDYPHYTRPDEVDGVRVPEVLLSGDHEAIRRWRLKQALGRTWIRRADLLSKVSLNDEQRRLLDEYIAEQGCT